jgi:MoaA/NifB/PqqE/SkfB family radical SAM enzyme
MSSPLPLANAIGSYLLKNEFKHMILHVTNLCNFRCEHCFVEFDDPSKKDQPLSVYEKLGSEMGKLFWLDIGGGEPFLRKDLPEIISCFDSQIVHIPTNGMLPDRIYETCKRIKDKVDNELIIGISIDGLKETHNKIRKNPKSWDNLWKTYKKISSLNGVSVKICTVITNSNYDEIIPLMEFVYKQGVDFHSVILLRGETIDDHVELPSINKLKKLAPNMFKILKKYDYGRSKISATLLRNFHKFLWKTSIQTLEQNTQIIPCLAGKAHIVTWGDGSVSSCEMLPPVGSLKSQSMEEITSSETFKKQIKFIEDKKCACTHNCAMLASTFFNPNNWPKLLWQNDIRLDWQNDIRLEVKNE